MSLHPTKPSLEARPRRRRSGANAVEFALTLPIILFILSGVVDYSYYLHLQLNMINAVTQGARAGVAAESDDSVSVAQNVTADVWTESGLPGFVTVTATISGVDPDAVLQVDGQLAFDELVGILPTPTNLRHRAIMRMENQP